MMIESFQDSPPGGAMLTAYDLAHIKTYLRLLDARDDPGATWQEAVHIIFGIDAQAEPDRARLVHDSHLARACWMTETGYRQLAALKNR